MVYLEAVVSCFFLSQFHIDPFISIPIILKEKFSIPSLGNCFSFHNAGIPIQSEWQPNDSNGNVVDLLLSFL